MKPKPGSVIGIDIGGTNIKLGTVTPAGKIIIRKQLETRIELGPEPTIERLAQTIRALTKQTKISGVGIGVAGLIDHTLGIVRIPPNLPGWDGVRLKDIVERKTGLPVYVGNDVNACVLGELYFGAGRGREDVFCLTLGTGVGGGIISGGRLILGANDAAGEIGHTIIEPNGPRCKCGNYGCLERLVGAEYIVANAIAELKTRKSSILDLALGDINKITPKIISRAAQQGDEVALKIIETIGYYVGLGIVNVVHLLDPAVVVIGGGIARAGKILLDSIKKTAACRIMMYRDRKLKICLSKLGSDAGILGASCFARHPQKRK